MLKWPCPNPGKNSVKYQFIGTSLWENENLYYLMLVALPLKMILILYTTTGIFQFTNGK